MNQLFGYKDCFARSIHYLDLAETAPFKSPTRSDNLIS